MSEEQYEAVKEDFNSIKTHLWADKKVIFHSRDIRKCDKEFKILSNNDVKAEFYSLLDGAIQRVMTYNHILSIKKEEYIKKYAKLKTNVYEIALSFIVERTVFYLDSLERHNQAALYHRPKG